MLHTRVRRALAVLLGCLTVGVVVVPAAEAGRYWASQQYVVGTTLKAETQYVSITRERQPWGWTVAIKGIFNDVAKDGHCARLRVRLFGWYDREFFRKEFNHCGGRDNMREIYYRVGFTTRQLGTFMEPKTAQVGIQTTDPKRAAEGSFLTNYL